MKLLTFYLIMFAAACGSEGYNEQSVAADEMEMTTEADYAEDQTATDNGTVELAERKIIRTAEMRMKVSDFQESNAKVEQLIANNQAYIANSQFNNNTYQLEQQLSIRVPPKQFDALIKAIEKEAIYVNFKNISATDVSEEYLDIETRLRTKKEVRDRYEEILRNKAKTVKDVLAAEEAIRVIQEEIESKEGRLRYLKNQIGYSTINLSLYEEIPYEKEPNIVREAYSSKFWQSLKMGWHTILDVILGLATIWPILLIVGLLIWQRKRLFGNKREVKRGDDGEKI